MLMLFWITFCSFFPFYIVIRNQFYFFFSLSRGLIYLTLLQSLKIPNYCKNFFFPSYFHSFSCLFIFYLFFFLDDNQWASTVFFFSTRHKSKYTNIHQKMKNRKNTDVNNRKSRKSSESLYCDKK